MDASIVSKSFLKSVKSADNLINNPLGDGGKLKTVPTISVGIMFHPAYSIHFNSL